jgi:hypothetical protein
MQTGSSSWVALAAAGVSLVCVLAAGFFAWIASKNAAAAAVRSAELAQSSRRVTEDVQKALAIAEQSVRTAQEGMSAIRSLAETSQRAYVTFDSLDVVHKDPTTGLPVVVRGEIRNAGKTPARTVVTCQWVRHLKDLPPEPDYAGLESSTSGILGPGSGERFDASGPRMDAALAQDLKRHKLVIFVYGVSRYEDLLGKAQETRWAFYWHVERQQFLRYPRHNDMT